MVEPKGIKMVWAVGKSLIDVFGLGERILALVDNSNYPRNILAFTT